ncbi:MAG: sulfatase-like hydrolase/transferase [Planctomycetes bacterium]|nr:sulfatase-like hydrolase/transferase [Planctomycetota bacterium]
MSKPNFIIFLTDDQGYGDLSCMGATDFRTPNLDRMAAGGVRFTDWYSNCPVCSPSRASLLTGRYPGNAGVRSILAGHRTAPGLPPSVPTIAKALGDKGYNTYMSGKWHLGTIPACRPSAHGFNKWFGHLAGCIDYFSHIFYWAMNKGPGTDPVHDVWEDDCEIYENGKYFTEMITEKAVDYIRESAKEDKPFILYVAYNAPHYPMHAPKKYMDRFSHLPWDRQVMAAMISAVDDGVGEIMNELERQGIEQNTCTFFTSDNGPSRETRNWLDGTTDPYYGGTTGKMKGHKFSLYDGGIKVPGIMHWPARVKAGQVLSEPVASMDVFPTIMEGAGFNSDGCDIDGRSILPLVEKGDELPERDLMWEMSGQLAIRRGDWKLVLNGTLVEGAPVEDAVHLSNVVEDMGERVNLKDKHPELVADMSAKVKEWYAGIEDVWENKYSKELNGLVTHAG